MKKVLVAIMSVVFGCVFLMAFAGCSDSIVSITDIERFSDMQSRADKIEVKFDNHTGLPFEFSITDEDDLEEIMEILLSETLSRLDEPTDGDNTIIIIYQGEKTYNLSVRSNSENKMYYAFSTAKLQEKITALATGMGAFDGVE